jgi:hypothetical protein
VSEVAAFTAVELNGSSNVTIRVGGEQHVAVGGDAAAVERVATDVRGDTLLITSRGWCGPSRSTAVDITVPELSGRSVAAARS